MAGNILRSWKFTRKERLLKRREFVELSKKGKKAQNCHFIALHMKNKTGCSRLGITVTKKVGNSATRNRIKRYCREFFRLNKHGISEDRDINIIAKKNATCLDSKKIFEQLEDLFKRI